MRRQQKNLSPFRANLHPHHRNFGSMVCDPFRGPLMKGLSGDPSAPDTVTVRRRAVIPINVGTITGSGVEIAIVMNGRRNPYAGVWDGASVSYIGREANDSGLVPVDSYARVVSSGVKVVYTGAEQSRGGIWHHFSYDREKSDAPAMAAFKTWGSLLNNLEYAVSNGRIGQNGIIGFVDSPEVGFGKVNPQGDNFLDAGMPDSSSDTSLLRLAFTGAAESCNVELHVSEVVEYYHVDHVAFATGQTIAPHAQEVHQSVNTLLSIKGSQNSRIDEGLASRVGGAITAATGAVRAGNELLQAASQGYSTLRQFWNDYLTPSTVTIEEIAEELPLLAL